MKEHQFLLQSECSKGQGGMTVRDATIAKGGRNQLPKMPVGHMSNSKHPQKCNADHIQVLWETKEGAGAAEVTLLRRG